MDKFTRNTLLILLVIAALISIPVLYALNKYAYNSSLILPFRDSKFVKFTPSTEPPSNTELTIEILSLKLLPEPRKCGLDPLNNVIIEATAKITNGTDHPIFYSAYHTRANVLDKAGKQIDIENVSMRRVPNRSDIRSIFPGSSEEINVQSFLIPLSERGSITVNLSIPPIDSETEELIAAERRKKTRAVNNFKTITSEPKPFEITSF